MDTVVAKAASDLSVNLPVVKLRIRFARLPFDKTAQARASLPRMEPPSVPCSQPLVLMQVIVLSSKLIQQSTNTSTDAPELTVAKLSARIVLTTMEKNGINLLIVPIITLILSRPILS